MISSSDDFNVYGYKGFVFPIYLYQHSPGGQLNANENYIILGCIDYFLGLANVATSGVFKIF